MHADPPMFPAVLREVLAPLGSVYWELAPVATSFWSHGRAVAAQFFLCLVDGWQHLESLMLKQALVESVNKICELS